MSILSEDLFGFLRFASGLYVVVKPTEVRVAPLSYLFNSLPSRAKVILVNATRAETVAFVDAYQWPYVTARPSEVVPVLCLSAWSVRRFVAMATLTGPFQFFSDGANT